MMPVPEEMKKACDHSRDRRVFDGGACKICLDCGCAFEISDLCKMNHKIGQKLLQVG